MTRLAPLFLLIALMWHAYEGVGQVYDDSITLDEFPHYLGGLDHWNQGTPRYNLEHPPLAKLLGTLPALLRDLQAPEVQRGPLGLDVDVARSAHHLLIFDQGHRESLWDGRMLMLIFPLLGLVSVFALSWRLAGPTAAAFSTLFMALDPNLLFHGHLITTDVPLTAMLLAAGWATLSHLERPRLITLLGVYVGVAAAVLVKFNGVVALVFLGSLMLNRGRRGILEAGGGLVFLLVALHGIYGFGPCMWGLPEAYLQGWNYVATHAQGRCVFLDGVAGSGSFPMHALSSCVAKVPVWLWVFALAGGVSIAWRRLGPLVMIWILCLAGSLLNPLNLGVRHSLPWMAALWVVSGSGVLACLRQRRVLPLCMGAMGMCVMGVLVWARGTSQWMAGLPGWEEVMPTVSLAHRCIPACILLVLAAVVWIFRLHRAALVIALLPLFVLLRSSRGYAGFESGLVGGGSRGFVADSNLDWGQDFVRLGRALDVLGPPKARAWLFGLDRVSTRVRLTAYPASYDRYRYLDVSDKPVEPGEYVVISEQVLALPSGIERYKALEALRPQLLKLSPEALGVDSVRVYCLPSLLDSVSTDAH